MKNNTKWFFTSLFSAVLLSTLQAQQVQADTASTTPSSDTQTTQAAGTSETQTNQEVPLRNGSSSQPDASSSAATQPTNSTTNSSAANLTKPTADSETTKPAATAAELTAAKQAAAKVFQQTHQPQTVTAVDTPLEVTGSMTFKYIDSTNRQPIIFDGAESSSPALVNDHNVASLTIHTSEPDPTTANTGDKTQYAVAIPGYAYVGNPATDVPDTFSAGSQTVNLTYTPLAGLDVKYVDVNDPDKLLWSYKLDSKYQFAGDSYKTDYFPIPFNGYVFDHVDGDATGQFGQLVKSATDTNPIQITYYYAKDPAYTGPTGTPLTATTLYQQQSPMASTKRPGDLIATTPSHVPGYTLISTMGIFQGTMPDHGENAIEEYLSNSPVTVNYIDKATGAVLKTVMIGTIDAVHGIFPDGQYQTNVQPIAGYQLDHIIGATSGSFDPVNKQVNYYYHKTAVIPSDSETTSYGSTSTVSSGPSTVKPRATINNAPTVTPTAKIPTTLSSAIINYIGPNNHLIDIKIVSGRIGNFIKPMLSSTIIKHSKQGFQTISSNIQEATIFTPKIQEYFVHLVESGSGNPFVQHTMPALNRLNDLVKHNDDVKNSADDDQTETNQGYGQNTNNKYSNKNGLPGRLQELDAVHKSQDQSDDKSNHGNNYNRQISATYQDDLARLAHFYHNGGGGSGNDNSFSSLADYFEILSGKINFGERPVKGSE
ncbi:MucBP domain-containing protein [Secundilactobacillus hailunensis]|uniref:MucBP domain-containing protein n=1 Tax=Secundilactobacillus hailunensis TaxID=2559923 RepID=A0ABW1T6D1_9LACO|nr:MucBP domain-containing protein [Secundilactobacillus hailunensis]